MIKNIVIGILVATVLVGVGLASYQKGPNADAIVSETHTESVDGQGYGQGGNGRGQGQGQVANAEAVENQGNGNGDGRGQGDVQVDGQGNGGPDPEAHDDHELLPASSNDPLTQAEIDGLLAAIDDEYHAWAIYDQVLADFGDARPFSNIINSEAQHIGSLVELFERYDIPVPENTWVGNVDSFESLQAACQGGVDAEIANAALYDGIFAGTDRSDILGVYQSLQSASANNHQAAFERCATR